MTDFPESCATEVDNFIDSCSGKHPSYEDVMEYMEMMNSEVYSYMLQKEAFIQWLSRRSKHELMIKRDWLKQTPAVNASVDKSGSTSTKNDSSSNNNNSYNYKAPVMEHVRVQRLHWYKFMCKVLLEMMTRLGADYVPIMGELIAHVTGKGSQVLPRFSYVVHPKEKAMYERVDAVLKEVIIYFKSQHIHMADTLAGVASLRKLEDGRYEFSMSIDLIP